MSFLNFPENTNCYSEVNKFFQVYVGCSFLLLVQIWGSFTTPTFSSFFKKNLTYFLMKKKQFLFLTIYFREKNSRIKRIRYSGFVYSRGTIFRTFISKPVFNVSWLFFYLRLYRRLQHIYLQLISGSILQPKFICCKKTVSLLPYRISTIITNIG